ncbi:MAG: hypothetical protein ACOCV8_01645 [Spirochaetota bacterium]
MRKFSLILFIFLIFTFMTFCGPQVSEEAVNASESTINDALASVSAPLLLQSQNLTSPTSSKFNIFTRQTGDEEDSFTIDLDSDEIDPKDTIGKGSITYTLIEEPTPEPVSISGYGSPITGFDSETGEPVFHENWLDTNNEVNLIPILNEIFEQYIDTEGGDDSTLTADDMNDIVTDVHNDIISPADAIGAELKISIEYDGFQLYGEMENALTGTITYTLSGGVGAKLSGSVETTSEIEFGEGGPTKLDVTGSVSPSAKFVWTIGVKTTGFEAVKDETTNTLDLDISLDGDYTLTLTASAKVTGSDTDSDGIIDDISVTEKSVETTESDSTSLSGSVTVNEETFDASVLSVETGKALFEPIEGVIKEIEENIDDIVNDLDLNSEE